MIAKTTHFRSATLSVLLLIVLLLNTFSAAAQDWKTASSGGGAEDDIATGIASDAEGNTYVVGHFSGTATLGSFTLTSAGRTDVFVAKYSAAGDVLWARSGGGADPGGDYSEAVTVDAAGNAYVTGWFNGTATFGGVTLTSAGGIDIFLAKYSPEGDVLWARSGGGTGLDQGYSVAVDTGGNAYVTGRFGGAASFGPFTLTSAGQHDVLLVKYSPEGDVLWARTGGGTGADAGQAVAVDVSGNVHVTGSFSGTATFGPFTLTLTDCGGFWGILVLKYSSEGDVLAAHNANSCPGNGHGIAADAGGNIYVTGRFWDTATFGPFTLTSAGLFDVFVVKYAPEGEVLWARSGGGAGWDEVSGIAADADGNAFVTGVFRRTLAFGSHTLPLSCGSDFFLVKYSPAGDVLWARSTGGARDESAESVTVTPSGDVSVAGFFKGTATFGGTRLRSAGNFDAFVARFNEDLPAPVSAQPLSLPVVIPAGGGSFAFTVTLTNTTGRDRTFEVWTTATGPVNPQPALEPQNVTLPAGATETLTLTQAVPAHAPAGTYTYHVRAGGFPCLVAADTSFPVVKEEGRQAASREGDDTEGWYVSGWDVAQTVMASAEALLPGGYALSAPRPNPFDARTRLTLELAEAQRVTAGVYDALGRRVAVLLDGPVAAGAHALVVEAGALPSGLYVVRVTGEHFTATRRLTLLR